jgi:hypothetical protein
VRAVVRPTLALAAVLAVGLATAASGAAAGPKTLTFADPAGDNTSPSAASDITGVTFTTTGTGKGSRYVAKNLVLTLTLAAPPSADGTVLYGIDTELAGCGSFYVNFMPGAELGDSFNYTSCGGDASDPTGGGASFDAVPEVKGSSIVWTLSMKSLPVEVKAGSTFSSITALTDFVDPVTGIIGSYGAGGPAVYDNASTDNSYVVG